MADQKQLQNFLSEYAKALEDRTAALFVGAGLSAPAGYPSWAALIGIIADEVGLDIKRETDFVTLAQFYFNENKQTKRKLTQKLTDIYGGKSKTLTENHRLLASLPIETVWTTNYDPLLENAFEAAGKQVDVKRSPQNLSKHIRGRDVTIYKMHGDVTALEDAVLMKDDYEIYDKKHEAFSTALRGDFVSKTFLFLGFSFTDPNIDYLLSRIRLLMKEEVQTHYCVMRWPKQEGNEPEDIAKYRHDRRRQELLKDDLHRYGVEAIMVDDWDELTEMLRKLNQRIKQRNIFVSGSASNYDPLGMDRVLGIARTLGESIIKEGYNLISGFGLGIGETVLNGALQTYYLSPAMGLADRITMRPFPVYLSDDPKKKPVHKKHREDMISVAGYAVFLCGNRKNLQTNEVELAEGVREEFSIAKKFGVFPIPIGLTEYVSREIWNEVVAEAKTFYPNDVVTSHLQILGNIDSTDEQIIDAVFSIIRLTSKP